MKLDAVSVLFGKAWERYKNRFVTLAGVYGVPTILFLAGMWLTAQKTIGDSIIGGVCILLGVVLSFAAGVAWLSAVGKGTDIKESYAIGFRLFWAMVWLSLLSGAVVIGGFVMLIIPGIMLGVQLSFALYAMVFEEKHGMAAIVLSREYVKGYWWAIVGRSVLATLMVIVVVLAVYLPIYILLGQIASMVVYYLLLILVAPFILCVQYEIFENLRTLKPDALERASNTKHDFLKVAAVLGIFGWILYVAAIIFVIGFFAAKSMPFSSDQISLGAGGYNTTDTTTLSITPNQAAIGDTVTITSDQLIDATDTVFMGGMVAAPDVTIRYDGQGVGTLTFKVPKTLSPYCTKKQVCPQFFVETTAKVYEVTVGQSPDDEFSLDAGALTVTNAPLNLE